MIEIRTPQEINNHIVLTLFDADDNVIGEIDNEFTMLDILVQIKENQLDGYYVEHEGKSYNIHKNGKLQKWRGYEQCGIDSIMERLVGF